MRPMKFVHCQILFFVLQQEALLKLGFYSGEEDMEFSSFSSGTERAVKTWQVSLCFEQYLKLSCEQTRQKDYFFLSFDISWTNLKHF